MELSRFLSKNKLISFLIIICLILFHSTSFSQNNNLSNKIYLQAESLGKEGNNLEAAKLFERAADIEKSNKKTKYDALETMFYAAAVHYYMARKYEQAINSSFKALEINKKHGTESKISNYLDNIANSYYHLENYLKSIEYFGKALAIYKRKGNQEEVAKNFKRIGIAYEKIDNLEKAIEFYLKALQIEKSLGKDKEISTSSYNIGHIYKSLGQENKAIEYYLQALEIDKKHGIKEYISDSSYELGVIYESMGHARKALSYFHSALEIDRELNRESEEANSLRGIGSCYYSFGEYQKAYSYFKEALNISEKLGEEREISHTTNLIGHVFKSLGQYEKSIDNFKNSLSINERLENDALVAFDLHSIGSVYSYWGKYEKALEYFQKSLEIDKRLGREKEVASHLASIGGVFSAWGQYDRSIVYYYKALEIDKRIGRQSGIAVRYNSIGGVYGAWGQYDKALEYYEKALEINKRLGRRSGIAANYVRIGGVYSSWNNYDKALEFYEKALNINKQLGKVASVASNHSSIGSINYYLENYEQAYEFFHQALEVNRKLGRQASIALDLNNIGYIYFHWKRYNEAIEKFKQALEINKRIGRMADAAVNLANLARALKSINQNNDAIKFLLQSIEIIEKIRKTADGDIRRDYLASQIKFYNLLASIYLNVGDLQGVLNAIEKSRARVLQESIADHKFNQDSLAINYIQNNLKKNEAIFIFSNLDEDNFILMVLTYGAVSVKELSKENFLNQCKDLYKKPILKLAQKKRGNQIHIDNDKIGYSFSLSSTRYKYDFENAINYYRILLSHPENLTDTKRLGREFYQLLFEPVVKQVSNKKLITIIPDGILSLIPFETFVDNNNEYLVNNFSFKYIQSLNVLDLINNRDHIKERRELLAIGGAHYETHNPISEPINNSRQIDFLKDRTYQAIVDKRSSREIYEKLGISHWPNLPGTLQEVKEISRIVEDSDTLIGDNVTENIIKMYSDKGKLAEYKVLHFATHGIAVPDIPELSALVLSQFRTELNGEDGYLRMGEIEELDLAADFVNLSACETGLGKIYNGEGVVGLTQSFLIAGANSLSASLWKVADISTTKFMVELYKKIETHSSDYNQAMTEVKREFINGKFGEEWKAPFYWAPFIYYGQ